MSFTNAEYRELLAEIVKSDPNTLSSLLRIVKLHNIEPDFTRLKSPPGRNHGDCIAAYDDLLARNPGPYDTIDERNTPSAHNIELENELERTRKELEAYKLGAALEEEQKRIKAELELKRLKQEKQKEEEAARAKNEAEEAVAKWKRKMEEEKEAQAEYSVELVRDMLRHRETAQAFESALKEIGQIVESVAAGAVDKRILLPSVEVHPEIGVFKRTMNVLFDQIMRNSHEAEYCEKTMREVTHIIESMGKGELGRKIMIHSSDTIPYMVLLKRAINVTADQLQDVSRQVIRVATEVGVDGILGGQAVASLFSGAWEKLANEGILFSRSCL
jgi:hypothetical protein